MRQAPERVIKLALLNTQARPDAPEAIERRRAMIKVIEAGGFTAATDTLYAMLVHSSRRADAALKKVVHAMADDIGPEAFVRQVQAVMVRPDSRPTLTAIACPTLVLTSDQDGIISSSLSVEMADAISAAKLVTIPDCGHLSQIEQPRAVADALVEWLRS
jgi:pimeloyl-ACP methyl ester carboxylesterase